MVYHHILPREKVTLPSLSVPLVAGGGNGCLDAREMDEQRQKNVSYQYLCHLEEAKK